MNILMIGDIVGREGRDALTFWLPAYKEAHKIDLCIANAENSAGGKGITANIVRELRDAGVDVITLGNHAWEQRSWLDEADRFPEVIRPWNGAPSWPGQGYYVHKYNCGKVLVVNLLGYIFMQGADNPFFFMERYFQDLLDRIKPQITIIDFYAEATAAKCDMAWYLADKVTAVCGTHTHVQTADERIIGTGTAFISDLGMTGSMDGVIGMDREHSLRRFCTYLPTPYKLHSGNVHIQGAIINVDHRCGQARSIKRLDIKLEDIRS